LAFFFLPPARILHFSFLFFPFPDAFPNGAERSAGDPSRLSGSSNIFPLPPPFYPFKETHVSRPAFFPQYQSHHYKSLIYDHLPSHRKSTFLPRLPWKLDCLSLGGFDVLSNPVKSPPSRRATLRIFPSLDHFPLLSCQAVVMCEMAFQPLFSLRCFFPPNRVPSFWGIWFIPTPREDGGAIECSSALGGQVVFVHSLPISLP